MGVRPNFKRCSNNWNRTVNGYNVCGHHIKWANSCKPKDVEEQEDEKFYEEYGEYPRPEKYEGMNVLFLTDAEASVLRVVCDHVDGDSNGPRGRIDSVGNQLGDLGFGYDHGIPTQGEITLLFDGPR